MRDMRWLANGPGMPGPKLGWQRTAQTCDRIPSIAPPGAQTCRTRQWSPHCSRPDKQTPWPPSVHTWEGSLDSPELSYHHHPPLPPSTALCGPVVPVLRRAWPRLQGAVPCFWLLSLCAQKGTLEAVGVGVEGATGWCLWRRGRVVTVQPAMPCCRAVFQGLTHCPARGMPSGTRGAQVTRKC